MKIQIIELRNSFFESSSPWTPKSELNMQEKIASDYEVGLSQ